MYGTPWHGEAGIADPGRGLPKGVYILRDEKNNLVPLPGAAAVEQLFPCSFVPFYSREGLNFTLGFLERVTKGFPCYQLSFVPDKRVVEFARGI